jgi:hypothetical protein
LKRDARAKEPGARRTRCLRKHSGYLGHVEQTIVTALELGGLRAEHRREREAVSHYRIR